jgi:hypothetical protein
MAVEVIGIFFFFFSEKKKERKIQNLNWWAKKNSKAITLLKSKDKSEYSFWKEY